MDGDREEPSSGRLRPQVGGRTDDREEPRGGRLRQQVGGRTATARNLMVADYDNR